MKFVNWIQPVKLQFLLFTVILAQWQMGSNQSDFNTTIRAPLLASYDKVKTQFNGVSTSDTAINYLQLTQNISATLPFSSCSLINQPTDLTLMFFFKIDYQQQINTDSDFQFFQFKNSVQCLFTNWTTITCDTPERKKLVVSYERNEQARWLHLTLSISKKGDAYLKIHEGLSLIGEDYQNDFYFQQADAKGAKVCFSMCVEDTKGAEYGFNGKIREVFARNSFTNPDQLTPNIMNVIQIYQSDVLGYYRLKDEQEYFSNQKVMIRYFNWQDWSVKQNSISGKIKNSTNLTNFSSLFKQSKLPIDVCPLTNQFKNFVSFKQYGQQILRSDLKMITKQKNYAYSMSLTLFVNKDTCWTSNIVEASANCSLVYLNEVFMLYFAAPNQAKFHFFAEKNYYESQTLPFFLPFNQWITIQMQMSQYSGYKIVILDTLGNIIMQTQRKQDMQTMQISKYLSLLINFSGIPSRFLLTDKLISLPAANYQFQDPLFNISFQNLSSTDLPNYGSNGKLEFIQSPELISVPYKLYEYGQSRSNNSKQYFDGITCDDNHLTVRLMKNLSKVEFQIDNQFYDYENEATIQFWFKLGDKSYYKPDAQFINDVPIFQMTYNQNFWQIFLRDSYVSKRVGNYTMKRELIIAPFGSYSLRSDVLLIFPEFRLENESEYGWWHLSCSFRKDETCECTLHNEIFEITRVATIENSFNNIPQRVFQAAFQNSINNLYVKEFRYWAQKLSQEQMQSTRYQSVFGMRNLVLSDSFEYLVDLLAPDFITDSSLVYQDDAKQLIQMSSKRYHAICPPSTYYKEGYCYSDPINQAIITIFPYQNSSDSELYWIFSLKHSSLIKRNLIQDFTIQLSSDDRALSQILEQSIQNDHNSSDILVNSRWLRQENIYEITALLTNEAFYSIESVQFIPSKCHWFQVQGFDAYQGRSIITDLPGSKDITFNLELVKNKKIDCGQNFNYYDRFNFDGFYINFIIDGDDNQYFTEYPYVYFDQIYSEGTKELTNINITIPSEQQYKLPLWTDIKILLKIKWYSSEYNETISDIDDPIFQNVLYTIQLAPSQSHLVTKLKANTQVVCNNQTLIISTNQTSITGVHPDLVRKNLRYKWFCPKNLEILCQGQTTSDTLYVPYLNSENIVIAFEKKYTFQVQISWLKPNNTIESKNDTIQVMWVNALQIPDYEIQCSPMFGPTYCKIVASDVNTSQSLSSYDIKWQINPAINSSYISNSTTLLILPNSWQSNIQYTIQTTLSLKQKSIVNSTIYYYFKSTNLGGLNSTTNSTNSTDDASFNSTDNSTSNSTEEFFNNSTEEFSNNSTENSTYNSTEDSTTNSTLDPSSNDTLTNSTDSMNYSTEDPSSYSTSTNSTDESAINQTDDPLSYATVDPTSDSTQDSSLNTTENFSSQFIEDNSLNTSDNSTIDNSIFENQTVTDIVDESQRNGARGLQAGVQSGLMLIFDEISQFTPQDESFISQYSIKLCVEFEKNPDISIMLKAYDLLDSLAIEYSIQQIQLLPILSCLNKFARNFTDEVAINEITERLLQIPAENNYQSDEIQLTSDIFNFQSAQLGEFTQINALNSVYLLDSKDLYWQFSFAPQQDFMMQSVAHKSFNDTTEVYLRVIDSMTRETYSIGQLDGRVQLSFLIPQDGIYRPNQTLCFAKHQSGWSSDLCLTELQIETKSVLCTCNMMEATEITLRDDLTKKLSEPVIVFTLDQGSQIAQIEGTSFFFMSIVIIICSLGLFGSIAVWRQDRQDWQQLQAANTINWQQQLLEDFADKIGQPLDQVKLRQKDILTYKVSKQSAFYCITSSIHPFFGPFTSFDARQTRLCRFNAYHLQINIYVMSCMMYFWGPVYRQGDLAREDFVLDAIDISSISTAIALGGIILLPIISEPICWILSNQIKVTSNKVGIVGRCAITRSIFIFVCLIFNLISVIASVCACRNSPSSNQYLMAISIFGGFIFATFVTNIARVFFNLYAPDWLKCLKSQKTLEILNDIKCVQGLVIKSSSKQIESTSQKRIKFEEINEVAITEVPFSAEKNEELQVQDCAQVWKRSDSSKYQNVSAQAPISARHD